MGHGAYFVYIIPVNRLWFTPVGNFRSCINRMYYPPQSQKKKSRNGNLPYSSPVKLNLPSKSKK